jgi:hypothetical protein
MRRRLPNRRACITEQIEAAGQAFAATVGFAPDGRPAEIFLAGAKVGSAMQAMAEDAAVVISIALQHGLCAGELGRSVSPGHASIIGAALDLLAECMPRQAIDAEFGRQMGPMMRRVLAVVLLLFGAKLGAAEPSGAFFPIHDHARPRRDGRTVRRRHDRPGLARAGTERRRRRNE